MKGVPIIRMLILRSCLSCSKSLKGVIDIPPIIKNQMEKKMWKLQGSYNWPYNKNYNI